MKKILTLVVSLALCLTISACSSNRAVKTSDIGENPNAPSASATVPETPSDTTASKPADIPISSPPDTPSDTPAGADKPVGQLEDMYIAYSDALENLIQNHIFPDGTDAAVLFGLSGDMAQNKFALCDVDNDGNEELLLMYTTADMAGHAGYVIGYDAQTKKLQTQLSEFPLLTFYDNGTIKAGWSHNQGRAGESFWPYNLYQYVPETDSYVFVGAVDAWDKIYPGVESNPFPSDIDISGTGFVYYIMENGQYDTTHPVDASEYNAWVSTYIGNASEIQIAYMDLTEENISQIRNGL